MRESARLQCVEGDSRLHQDRKAIQKKPIALKERRECPIWPGGSRKCFV